MTQPVGHRTLMGWPVYTATFEAARPPTAAAIADAERRAKELEASLDWMEPSVTLSADGLRVRLTVTRHRPNLPSHTREVASVQPCTEHTCPRLAYGPSSHWTCAERRTNRHQPPWPAARRCEPRSRPEHSCRRWGSYDTGDCRINSIRRC